MSQLLAENTVFLLKTQLAESTVRVMFDGAANWNQANESASCRKHSILAESITQVMFDGAVNWN